MPNPMASILIPAYNSEEYLEEAILSVLNQTWQNCEIIIVDDGSTDNSLLIARKYESEKVKVFSQPHSGAPRARNLAFEKSSGDYIQYLDADDLLAPNKIEEHVKILEEYGNKCLSFCSYTRNFLGFKTGTYIWQEINKDYLNPMDLLIDIFNDKGNVLTTSWLIPRELIQKNDPWDERLIKAQDGEFFVKVALKSKKILFCGQTTVFYRPTPFGRITTNQSSEALESVILSTESIQNSILRYEDSLRTRQALAYLYSRIFCSYYSKKNVFQLRKVEANIHSLQSSLIFVGNKYFKLLSKLVGIKNSLSFKNMLKEII